MPSNNLLNTEQISQTYAYEATIEMINIAHNIADQNPDKLEICTDYATLRSCIDKEKIALLLHIEGAEAISSDLGQIEILYNIGLRSIGPVWSRKNIFAEGVNFSFPSTPDQGDGLTDAGKELIRFCNRKKILVDLSHLNEKGFWEITKISDKPLVIIDAFAFKPKPLPMINPDAIATTFFIAPPIWVPIISVLK